MRKPRGWRLEILNNSRGIDAHASCAPSAAVEVLMGNSLWIQVMRSEVWNKWALSFRERISFSKQVERMKGSAEMETMDMMLIGC